MTNSERAEKIARLDQNNLPWDKFVEMVTSQLDSAVREAIQNAETIGRCADGVAYKAGFAAAREKALGISECYHDWGSEKIAERIRAMSLDIPAKADK